MNFKTQLNATELTTFETAQSFLKETALGKDLLAHAEKNELAIECKGRLNLVESHAQHAISVGVAIVGAMFDRKIPLFERKVRPGDKAVPSAAWNLESGNLLAILNIDERTVLENGDRRAVVTALRRTLKKQLTEKESQRSLQPEPTPQTPGTNGRQTAGSSPVKKL